jgi:hypothetical protein
MARAPVTDPAPLDVSRLMREIEDGVRRDRRARLVARGGPPEYQDAAIYASVEAALRRALESRDPDVLLFPQLVGDETEWHLQTHLTFSTHRGALGVPLIWVKRRILLPLMRWLYEYTLANFNRQERINRVLFACIEELAIQNAKLSRELQDYRIAELQKGKEKGA